MIFLQPLGALGDPVAAVVSNPVPLCMVSVATAAPPSAQQQLLGEVGATRFAATELLSMQFVSITRPFQPSAQVTQMAQLEGGPSKGCHIIISSDGDLLRDCKLQSSCRA